MVFAVWRRSTFATQELARFRADCVHAVHIASVHIVSVCFLSENREVNRRAPPSFPGLLQRPKHDRNTQVLQGELDEKSGLIYWSNGAQWKKRTPAAQSGAVAAVAGMAGAYAAPVGTVGAAPPAAPPAAPTGPQPVA